MIDVLDGLTGVVAAARCSAVKEADAATERQIALNDELAFLRAFERMESFDDFKVNGRSDGENDVSFVHDRIADQGAKDRADDQWQTVRLLRPHGELNRGEIVEVARSEAQWMARLGLVEIATESEAAEWFDARENGTAAPSIGDGLRIAALLHGR